MAIIPLAPEQTISALPRRLLHSRYSISRRIRNIYTKEEYTCQENMVKAGKTVELLNNQ